jgi:putative polyketide hydroxylase
MDEHTAVLVAGGSLSGLSAAVFLAARNVPCVVVERHPGTAVHPRARGITARSMELLRSVGLEERIRDAGREQIGLFVRASALADDEHHAVVMPQTDTPPGVSPTQLYACDQDRLEPLLLDRARELGADVRFGTELVSWTEAGDGIRAVVRDAGGGPERTIRADYLFAADGLRSRTREDLGIRRHGPGTLKHQVSVLFRADLDAALRGRVIFACFLEELDAVLVRRDSEVWQLGYPYYPDRGERAEDITPERALELIRRVTGLPEVTAEIVGIMSWEIAALVAERYRHGRVFLVGDAAHVTSPRGGLGGNACIQDAHNLAWKVAAVLAGQGGDGLLDTYEIERRPVADLIVGYALGRLRGEPLTQDYSTVSIGYRYHSAAVLTEPDDDQGLLEDPRTPSGRPGTRAAHVDLERSGQALSALDLFGPGYTLLAGAGGDPWIEAAAKAAADAGVPVTGYRIGPGGDLTDHTGRWADRYGIDAAGAVLVRPDGYVAWRSRAGVADPAGTLRTVLGRLSFRDTGGTPVIKG